MGWSAGGRRHRGYRPGRVRQRPGRTGDHACRAFDRSGLRSGSPQPYQLYTHCGIYEARIGNRYFEAVHPLSDGQGNPPPGWGNPYQQGTMTLLPPAGAVFRDRACQQAEPDEQAEIPGTRRLVAAPFEYGQAGAALRSRG